MFLDAFDLRAGPTNRRANLSAQLNSQDELSSEPVSAEYPLPDVLGSG